jgi:ADP-heptose:LPS heptosyltransferase
VLDQRIVINDRGAGSGGLTFGEALQTLRRNRFEVALDLQGLLKSAAMARFSGAGKVIGFNRRYARESLASLFYNVRHDPGGEGIYAPSEIRHVVDINLGMLQSLGLTSGEPEFPIVQQPSAVADAMRDETGDRYALLNPGAAWPNKRWPPARLAALAEALRTRHDLRSVVLWGPGEEALAEEVVRRADGAAVLTPRTTIADVIALARGAAVMVSGDTGPTHLGAAVGTPLVGIYGPTRPERNGPWRPGDQRVSRASICQCHHYRQCRAARMCLLDIEVAEVVGAVERRLAVEPDRV